MGLFNFLKAKEPEIFEPEFPTALGAPAKGSFVAMADIPDPAFSGGLLGPCCGVDPAEGKVYAPADCKVTQLTDTLHALGLEAGGVEILIHVGVDTVCMNGDGFSGKVKLGQTLRKGELIMTMDLNKIQAAGYAPTVIMAVTNADEVASVESVGTGPLAPGDVVLQLHPLSEKQ